MQQDCTRTTTLFYTPLRPQETKAHCEFWFRFFQNFLWRMFKTHIIQLGRTSSTTQPIWSACVRPCYCSGATPPTWQVIVTEQLHGLASFYLQGLVDGARSTNMMSVMYSCVRAFLGAAGLFSFVSILWMLRWSPRPPCSQLLCPEKLSHGSVAVKPPSRHRRHTHAQTSSSAFSFHPLPQSTGCNIPASHPRLSCNDITHGGDRHTVWAAAAFVLF